MRLLLILLLVGMVHLTASSHTLMHLSLYDVKREIVLTDNKMVTRHECMLRVDDVNTSNPLFEAVDTDLDGTASQAELDALNEAAATYLVTDFIVFVDRDMLASTTGSLAMLPDQAGFKVDVLTDLAQVQLPETTATVTIIDPAFLFPPTEVTRAQPPTRISSNHVNLVDKNGVAVKQMEVETGAASSFNWKPVAAKP